jgi:hypothetical protein
MVCTFFGISIFYSKQLWSIFWKFGVFFGDLDKERKTTNKLWAFHQGTRLTFVYAFEFKQLTCDIFKDEATLMNQF